MRWNDRSAASCATSAAIRKPAPPARAVTQPDVARDAGRRDRAQSRTRSVPRRCGSTVDASISLSNMLSVAVGNPVTINSVVPD